MPKIRCQLMLEYDVYQQLIGLQGHFHVKTLSILVNKVLKEAFKYQRELDTKEKQIVNLQNVITELGDKAENYRAKLLSNAEVIKE